jgi:hypothetical protein
MLGGDATILGGPLTVKNSWGAGGAAIYLWNPEGGASLAVDDTALALESGGYGILAEDLGGGENAVQILHADVEIAAAASCVRAYGSFNWNDCDLTGGLEHSSGGWFELDDQENTAVPATHVKFMRNKHYDLWIEGTQVGDANCADVLGDGTFSYDPISRTLTVKQDHSSLSSMLWSEVQALTVYIARDLKLENTDMMTGTLLSFAGDTAIRGPGRLTLRSPRDCLTVTDGAVLRIETPALDARSEMYCAVRGANGGERLVLSGAELSAVGCADPYGYSGGVTGFTGGIDPGSCAVTEPEGGYVDPVSGSVVDPASGKPAETVRILPVWRYDRSSGSLQIALASGEWPVWAASYDASGRFLGLVRITAPGGYPVSGLLKAGGDHLKIFRADMSTWVPDCAAETIYP